MTFILNVVCNVQLKSDKARAFKGVQGTAGGIDLMIVDIPEGLPVLMVSSLTHLSLSGIQRIRTSFPCCLILEVFLSMTMGHFYSSTKTI
jgi:hypothetical protein